jgi:hypothetical protein
MECGNEYFIVPAPTDNMAEKTLVKTHRASFPPRTIPKMSLRSILGIGAADERKASAMIVIIGFQGYRHAKRHFGYQADERLKPKLPLRGTSLIRRPVSHSLQAN